MSRKRTGNIKTGIVRACIIALLAGAAFGQPPGATPKFDTADVHAGAPSPNQFLGPVLYRSERYELRNATLLNLITTAYGVDADKIVNGPA
jgi:hypothetical protein